MAFCGQVSQVDNDKNDSGYNGSHVELHYRETPRLNHWLDLLYYVSFIDLVTMLT